MLKLGRRPQESLARESEIANKAAHGRSGDHAKGSTEGKLKRRRVGNDEMVRTENRADDQVIHEVDSPGSQPTLNVSAQNNNEEFG